MSEDYRVVIEKPARELKEHVFSKENTWLRQYLDKHLNPYDKDHFPSYEELIEGETDSKFLPRPEWFMSVASVYFVAPNFLHWLNLQFFIRKSIALSALGYCEPKDWFFEVEKPKKQTSAEADRYDKYMDLLTNKWGEKGTPVFELDKYVGRIYTALAYYILDTGVFEFKDSKDFKLYKPKKKK